MKNNDTIKNNLLTYTTIIEDRLNFKKSGGVHSDQFNIFDDPGVKYFKIFFYFNNGDSDSADGNTAKSTGLLAPTWELANINDSNYYQYNTAWSYLKMNYEDQRADQLKQFVNLLSNISTKSPWYFSEISGLDAALERKQTMDTSFKFEEERKKISIKCLPDAQDNRIGTLLDLYRSIVWSWHMKRAVLPANLRKFDMGIFIFSDSVSNLTVQKKYGNNPKITKGRLYNQNSKKLDKVDDKQAKGINGDIDIDYQSAQIGGNDPKMYRSSYKYIEFHNCEIDYNSGKTAWGSLSNTEGTSASYTIDILFDDCYEHNYNEFNMKVFGDMIVWDLISKNYEYEPSKNTHAYQKFVDMYNTSNGVKYEWLSNNMTSLSKTVVNNIVKTSEGNNYNSRQNIFNSNSSNRQSSFSDQIVGVAKDAIMGLAKKAVLGNLYTFSLTRMYDQAKDLLQGDVWSVARGVAEYIGDAKQRNEHNLPSFHSMFEQTTVTKQYLGESQQNLFHDNAKKRITPRIKRMGNLAKTQSMINNV